MKKLVVVLGLAALAMAGKCSSSDTDRSKETSEKPAEEFPVKEDSQVPPEEVPSYEQQEDTAPAPTETPVPNEGASAPSSDPSKAPTR